MLHTEVDYDTVIHLSLWSCFVELVKESESCRAKLSGELKEKLCECLNTAMDCCKIPEMLLSTLLPLLPISLFSKLSRSFRVLTGIIFLFCVPTLNTNIVEKDHNLARAWMLSLGPLWSSTHTGYSTSIRHSCVWRRSARWCEKNATNLRFYLQAVFFIQSTLWCLANLRIALQCQYFPEFCRGKSW